MEYCCNIPVLIIFFNRPETFSKVFEKIKKAKPKVFILAQDGPRNDNDIEGINACRAIAENIDWDCQVIKNYSEKNLGCGVRPQSAISFALEQYDRVIILEDDCVPADSFFPYCEELLERYKDDQRIAYISGLNHFETWDCGDYDYFFSKAGSIGAWATWRRSWTQYYDYYVSLINNAYVRKLYRQQVGDKVAYEKRLTALINANNSLKKGDKLSYWDTQWGFAEYIQNMLVIVPRANLIYNIGVGALSTHATSMKVEKYIKYKNIVFIPIHEINFPLRNPPFCSCDLDYHNLVYKCSRGNIIKRIIKKVIKRT